MIESDPANVLLLATPAGGVLVDSGAPEQGAALAKLVAEQLAGAPLAAIFNTHWHLDHTGGNDVFGKTGTKIVAHENTRLWMSTEYYVDWQDTTYEPRSAEALPTDTFFASDPQPRSIDLGGERIEYGHLREAHTDGDIYVLFRERNVLAAGGAVGGRRLSDHRLRDGRLDRRPDRREQEAARPRERQDADRRSRGRRADPRAARCAARDAQDDARARRRAHAQGQERGRDDRGRRDAATSTGATAPTARYL